MIGQSISHYKILEKIGEGGMGVVYKAEDTRLGRSVALKFLPSSFATQKAAKRRFVQEAKAASSLEHPNICAIYDIGETSDGQIFIAMPHYNGQTLQEKIAERPMDIAEAIDVVVQVASGLAKAHEQGIVHRDIKPGNLFITTDGHVKILDFGLAKLISQTRLTKSGMTVGTVAYMSPEQASGGDLDTRSDIFSLGVLFYELLTGTLPFKGDHEAAILYGIIHNDPEPLQKHRPDAPDELQRVIERTLAKNVDDRYQSVHEFKDALAGLEGAASSNGHVPVRASRSPLSRLVRWAVLIGAAVAITIFMIRSGVIPTSDRSPRPSPTYTQLTFSGDAFDAIVSPDGQFIAYRSGKQLLVRDVGGGNPVVALDDLGQVPSLRWSPDGSRILVAAWQDGKPRVSLIPRLGGSIRHLKFYPYVAWSPDGSRLAGTSQPSKFLSFIDVSTGNVDEDALALDLPIEFIHEIDWSPDGNNILVNGSVEGHGEVWVVGLDGADPKRVIKKKGRALGSPRWAPSGESIYYVVPTGLIADLRKVSVDVRSGDAIGEPEVVLSGITTHIGLNSPLAFSRDGKRFAFTKSSLDMDLVLVPIGDQPDDGDVGPVRLTTGSALDRYPSVSPDGRGIAFLRTLGTSSNIFIMPIEGGTATQVTFMDNIDAAASPVWSPDGREIAFLADNRVCVVSAEGGATKVFHNTHAELGNLAWAPGKNILYRRPDGRDLVILNPESGDESPLTANEDNGWILFPAVAPDGESVAVYWNGEKTGIWIISMVDSTRSLVRTGGRPVGWSPDGQWIYYTAPGIPRFGRVRANGSEDEPVQLSPGDVHVSPYIEMSPDAKAVVGATWVETPSDIWLVENFDPDVR